MFSGLTKTLIITRFIYIERSFYLYKFASPFSADHNLKLIIFIFGYKLSIKRYSF